MRKPKYMEELLIIIFIWLSVAFVCTAILCFIGVLKPKASSIVQVPVLLGTIFAGIGLFFAVVSIILGVVIMRMKQLHAELVADGIRLHGVVEKVYLQKNTQYGKQSPYRILYVYTYQDKEYHHKSCFIWEKPNLMIGDSITVYANDFGKSTIMC